MSVNSNTFFKVSSNTPDIRNWNQHKSCRFARITYFTDCVRVVWTYV